MACFHRMWFSVPLLCSGLLSAARGGPTYDADMQVYQDRQRRFLLSFPQDWTARKRDEFGAAFTPEDGQATCGLHFMPINGLSLQDFANALYSIYRDELGTQGGPRPQIVYWKSGSLLDGTPMIERMIDLLPGGRSMQTHFTTEGTGVLLDCETYVEGWDVYEDVFRGIAGSMMFLKPAP